MSSERSSTHAGQRDAPWLLRFQTRPEAALVLVCLPHAGAGASTFRTWSGALPEWAEVAAVQLPGRETRIREPLRRDLEALADELARALVARVDRPYALYGHSLGARLALEVTRRMPDPGPVHLFVAGHAAPHLHASHSDLHRKRRDEVVAELARDGVAPAAVLADGALMAMLVPILQADIAMCVTHGRAGAEPLDVPISAWAGSADTTAPPRAVADWAQLTTAGFRFRVLPGGHFFPLTQRDALIGVLQRDLLDAIEPMAA